MIDITSTIISQALIDQDNLEVAYETWKAFNTKQIHIQIRECFVKELINSINNEIFEVFPDIQDKIDWIDESVSFQIRISANIQKNNWKYSYKFGIRDYDSDRLHFYILCSADDKEKRINVHSLIKDQLKEGNRPDNHWWSKAKEPYNEWDKNYQVIKQFAFCDRIALKYFASRIIDFINVIDEIESTFSLKY